MKLCFQGVANPAHRLPRRTASSTTVQIRSVSAVKITGATAANSDRDSASEAPLKIRSSRSIGGQDHPVADIDISHNRFCRHSEAARGHRFPSQRRALS